MINAKKNTVLMTPRTVYEVEKLVYSRQLWKLGASGTAACKRVVREAIDKLTADLKYPTQVNYYLREKTRLERLLEKLGD